jgi:prepilin-type N-terminal cleavage/methylation domain-containing protein
MNTKARQPMPRRTSQGFSLVEMLVVAGIVALLAGLLMPAVNLYRENTRMGLSQSIINTLDGACKYYQVDFGYYPPSGDVSVDGINQGYQLLPWALVGYQDSAKDNCDGFGFRVDANRGKVYGPYNDAEKLAVQGSPPHFVDSFDEPILYYRFDGGTYNDDHNPSDLRPNNINDYAKNDAKPQAAYYRKDFILLSQGPDDKWNEKAGGKNITNFKTHE